MLPIVQVPETIKNGFADYRDVFCRDEGFDHVSRYVTGLIISSNKTLQGIYDIQYWDGKKPGRRSMHESVFESGWGSDKLIQRHQAIVAPDHRGRSREVISLDWTFFRLEIPYASAKQLLDNAVPRALLYKDANYLEELMQMRQHILAGLGGKGDEPLFVHDFS